MDMNTTVRNVLIRARHVQIAIHVQFVCGDMQDQRVSTTVRLVTVINAMKTQANVRIYAPRMSIMIG